MWQRKHYRKIVLVAYDLLQTPRWSLPIPEPDHLPVSLPRPRVPVYPRLPRKIHLMPIPPETRQGSENARSRSQQDAKLTQLGTDRSHPVLKRFHFPG